MVDLLHGLTTFTGHVQNKCQFSTGTNNVEYSNIQMKYWKMNEKHKLNIIRYSFFADRKNNSAILS